MTNLPTPGECGVFQNRDEGTESLGKDRRAIMNNQPIVQSPYLTSAEAAAYIRSTVQGIYALVKRRRIKPMPGSGKLLFTREALDKYLSGSCR